MSPELKRALASYMVALLEKSTDIDLLSEIVSVIGGWVTGAKYSVQVTPSTTPTATAAANLAVKPEGEIFTRCSGTVVHGTYRFGTVDRIYNDDVIIEHVRLDTR